MSKCKSALSHNVWYVNYPWRKKYDTLQFSRFYTIDDNVRQNDIVRVVRDFCPGVVAEMCGQILALDVCKYRRRCLLRLSDGSLVTCARFNRIQLIRRGA